MTTESLLVQLFLLVVTMSIIGICVVIVAIDGQKKDNEQTAARSFLFNLLAYTGLLVALIFFATMFLVVPIRALS